MSRAALPEATEPRFLKKSQTPFDGSGGSALKTSLAAASLIVGAAAFFYAFWLTSRFEPVPGGVSMSADRLARRIAVAEERLKTDPENIELLTRAGELHFQAGPAEYATAINELEDALDLGALNPSIFYDLGVMYQSEGLYPFALKEYDRYLRHFPHATDVAMRKAKLLYEAGRYEEAADEYADLLRGRPSDPLLKENLALSLWRAKKGDEAKQILSQMMASGRNRPEAIRARYYMGRIAFEEKDFAGAQTAFESCAAQGGVPGPGIGPADLARDLAKTYQALKKYRDAAAQWKLVLAQDPKDKQAAQAVRRYARYLVARPTTHGRRRSRRRG